MWLDVDFNQKRKSSSANEPRAASLHAVIPEAQKFLMDDPISNLDAKMRVDVQAKIKVIGVFLCYD